MAKSKKQKTATPPVVSHDRAPCWEVFFRDQKSPLLRSQLITALMSGHQLEVERLPTATLLDAVLLSMSARSYSEAEIVDDYNALLRRTDAAWKDPMWTRRTFDQTHMNAADFIITCGSSEFTCVEDEYIPDLVHWLLEHDPPEYFSEELAA
jgi:hypothetical protein